MTLVPVASSLCVALVLTACSSDKNDPSAGSSEFNPNAESPANPGAPGGDTTAIAGLWDGTVIGEEAGDIVYWHLADNGVLTRYDYQQDGIAGANDQNCYVVGDPITVTPEGANAYSIANTAVTIVRTGDNLEITFVEADRNDFDGDGDTAESPTLNWATDYAGTNRS